jgi:hypothetical protein
MGDTIGLFPYGSTVVSVDTLWPIPGTVIGVRDVWRWVLFGDGEPSTMHVDNLQPWEGQ